jgi:TPR repeat protein
MGAPRFYDKLLCVPALNLSVRALDRLGYGLDRWGLQLLKRIRAPRFVWAGSPRTVNFRIMSIWIVLFGVMLTTGFITTGVVGTPHPGADPAFWQQACDAHRHNACPTWVGILNVECEGGSGSACFTMGKVTNRGLIVPREPATAARGLGRACDLGEPDACQAFTDFVSSGGEATLEQSCNRKDAISCFFLGTVLHLGKGAAQDEERALRVFKESCNDGYVRGCGVLGDMYQAGQGAPADTGKALENYDRSCAGRWGESCMAAAMLYHRRSSGAQDEALALKRMEQGCELGYQPACKFLEGAGGGASPSR